uniref:hypothetical protein n=1 Tax=Acinetobacter baumannii TaxID=470 RepID=UPI003F65694A
FCFEHGGVRQMNYKEMMALRCAYNHGLKTTETRAAACLYIKLRRAGKIEEFKAESMTKHDSINRERCDGEQQ